MTATSCGITHKLLIANRGEIARRILKACREKNILAAVITTIDDKNSLVCREADAVLEVDSFLNAQKIVEQAKNWGADLLHPGYGFLSENAQFAKLCEENGILFIGPTSEQIKSLGSKESSKKIAKHCGVPVLASLSSNELKNIPPHKWQSEFEKLGIHSPYLIKASGGGGGRGMRVVHDFKDIPDTLLRASDEALHAFNDDTVFVERYLKSPRHIEIQVFGDGKGGGVFFGERECSLQRRHQKVIEECPSTVITPELRSEMGKASLAIVAHTKYRGAGTVEFLFDESKNFYFLEMNTRLQVEHPVTEMVYGIDLVHMQIDLALGEYKDWFQRTSHGMTTAGNLATANCEVITASQEMTVPNREMIAGQARGVALEARILAEDPRQNFLPTPGKIEEYIEPCGEGIRIDSGVTKGSVILPSFDSMIAKLVVHAETRELAIQKMLYALKNYLIFGITTNIPFLIALVSRKEFLAGEESTHFIEQHLAELNETLIPQKTIDFLKSFSFREKLFYQYKFQHYDNQSTINDRCSSEMKMQQGASERRVYKREAHTQATSNDAASSFPMSIARSFKNNSAHVDIFSRQQFKKSDLLIDFIQNPNIRKITHRSFINSKGQMEVNMDGEVIILENPGFYNQNFSQSFENSGEIKSPMAGKVYDILISCGDTVKKGDLLFIIESMKMQLEVRSSHNGIIGDICVSKGQILMGPQTLGMIR